MHPTRIVELLHPFLNPPNVTHAQLTEKDLKDISTYIDILTRWNCRINLTAIRDQEEIVTRHFGESFFAARHLLPRTEISQHRFVPGHCFNRADPTAKKEKALAPGRPIRVADLGSGAGFPGIPIKMWASDIALTLVESNQKKSAFLREVSRALTFTDIDIQNVRAETLPRSSFDLVTVRAVERLEKILPTAANLLAPSGRLALLISLTQRTVVESALPKMRWDDPILLPASNSNALLIAHHEPK